MILKNLRPEYDGRRLVSEDRAHAWLVFHGLRHHITSSIVYDCLFRPDLSFDFIPELDDIAEGPDLAKGTCLVSDMENGQIHLVFGSPSINVRKHLIETYESFEQLGFDQALVRAVPPLLLSAIPAGRPIRFEVGAV